MKFILETNAYFYPASDVDRLTKLGFKMIPWEQSRSDRDAFYMDPRAQKPSVDISTLAELMSFIGEHGAVVIYDGKTCGSPNGSCPPHDGQPSITIYDDRE